MKVFITGASGYIGSHLVEKLSKSNHVIYALARSQKDSSKLKKLGADKVVIGDISEPKKFSNVLNSCDTVVHLAALRSNWMSKEDFLKINSYSVENLLKYAPKIKHFVYTSSVYVFGNIKHLPANEETQRKAHDLYGISKVIGEDIVENTLNNSKTKYTIIRPAIVYGPGDNNSGMIMKMITMVKNQKLPIIGNGKNTLHLIYIDDLVDGIIKVINSKPTNDKYILAGPETIQLEKLINLVSENLRLKYSPKRYPRLPIYLVSYVVEFIFGMGRQFAASNHNTPSIFMAEPPLLPIKVEVLSNNWGYDISKAKSKIGFVPKVGYKAGIAKTVKWYLQTVSN